jgi:hypothetical protein
MEAFTYETSRLTQPTVHLTNGSRPTDLKTLLQIPRVKG